MRNLAIAIALLFLGLSALRAGTLEVQTGKYVRVASAKATAPGPDVTTQGTATDGVVRFENLLADEPYEVQLTLTDGTVVQGVNMDWYNEDPAKPDAGDLDDDDRKQIQAIMNVPSFYNHNDILRIRGDHNRAVVLAQLVRDSQFHSDKGDEVIWRVELWYFENQYGGWARTNQTNRVLRRVRFKTHAAYDAAMAKLKWAAELGGIRVGKDKTVSVTMLSPDAPASAPATQPSGNDK